MFFQVENLGIENLAKISSRVMASPSSERNGCEGEGEGEAKPQNLMAYQLPILLKDPDKHISRHGLRGENLPKGLKTCGSSISLTQWYEKLDPVVKQKVDNAGFGRFISSLCPSSRAEKVRVISLAERWWDTTGTLHFPFGEIGMTPYDFSVITGLRIGGKTIPYNARVHRSEDDLLRALGSRPPVIRGSVPCSWLFDNFHNVVCNTDSDREFHTRAFILYLFGCTMFGTLDCKVSLNFLPALEDVDRIGEYDWGGAAYAALCTHMNSVSRGKVHRLGGLWKVWEIWSYEYFGLLAPSLKVDDSMAFPRSLRWSVSEFEMCPKHRMADLKNFREAINNLTIEKVNWNPWGEIEPTLPPEIRHAKELSRQRILLAGPSGQFWFLGERLSMQTLGSPQPMVPHPPPMSVRLTASFSIEELEGCFKGFPAERFIDYSGHYDDFRASFLMPPFRNNVPSVVKAMLFNCVCILQLYMHSKYVFHLHQDVRGQGETSTEGLHILSDGIEIPNRPSQNIYLPNEDGIFEQVEVPRVSYGEGLPLPPHVHLAYRPHLEEAYQLISGLKHLVLVLKTEAQFHAQANRKLQAKEGYLYEQIADLKAQLRDRGISQHQDVRSSFYRPYVATSHETCCPGTPTPLPPRKDVSTRLEERLYETTGTDALVRPGTQTLQPVGSPSYPSSSVSQPKRPAPQQQPLADYWSFGTISLARWIKAELHCEQDAARKAMVRTTLGNKKARV